MSLNSYVFKRPHGGTPRSGIIEAKSVGQAFLLLTRAYGYSSNMTIYSPETGITYDENGTPQSGEVIKITNDDRYKWLCKNRGYSDGDIDAMIMSEIKLGK